MFVVVLSHIHLTMYKSLPRTKYETRKIPIISPPTEIFLTHILQKYKPHTCVEIGSAIGYSSSCIAQTIKSWWGKLITFEISQPAYKECLATLQKTYTQNTVTAYPFDFVKIDHQKFLPKNIDFVFIDGRKSEYSTYMQLLEPYLHMESIVLIDDVIKFKDRLDNIYSYLDKMQYKYTIHKLDSDDGVLLVSKN